MEQTIYVFIGKSQGLRLDARSYFTGTVEEYRRSVAKNGGVDTVPHFVATGVKTQEDGQVTDELRKAAADQFRLSAVYAVVEHINRQFVSGDAIDKLGALPIAALPEA